MIKIYSQLVHVTCPRGIIWVFFTIRSFCYIPFHEVIRPFLQRSLVQATKQWYAEQFSYCALQFFCEEDSLIFDKSKVLRKVNVMEI